MKIVKVVFIAVVTFLAAGCAGSARVGESMPLNGLGTEVYTLTNLHPDEDRGWLYSVNYQRGGLIPLCTKVRFETLDSVRAEFRVVEGQRVYTYIFHTSMQGTPTQHLAKYFGPSCDPAALEEGMSQVDLDGIHTGRALPGMSKKAVVLAIGYPPEHRTPSLDLDRWIYWSSKIKTFNVYFADGVVSRVR